MTKRERERVAEMLRCAADDDGGHPRGLIEAFRAIRGRHGRRTEWLAWRAYDAVKTETPGMYRAELLEAALRVEEGSWP